MQRRQFLALGLAALFGATGSWGVSSRAREDWLTEVAGVQANEQLTRARSSYREWLEGRRSSAATSQELARIQRSLTSSHSRLPVSVAASLVDWKSQQVAELRFMQQQVLRGQPLKQSDSELQARWIASLNIQRGWLNARKKRLSGLLRGQEKQAVQQFYQWRLALLPLLEEDLDLATDLARTFTNPNSPSPNGTRRSLRIYQRAQSVRPSAALRATHELFQQRFAALTRLADTAESVRQNPDADGIANLLADEAAYYKLTLEGERNALQSLTTALKHS